LTKQYLQFFFEGVGLTIPLSAAITALAEVRILSLIHALNADDFGEEPSLKLR
jgi:hypothetical protein